jgi:chloramphenicol O-acetyltransferase type A
MREIDIATWPRKKHFEVFNSFDYPHFNLCANVDISNLYSLAKTKSKSLHTTLVYIISRTANDYPEFRWRIRKDKVVEHDIVHPSASIPSADDLFSFCTMRFYQTFTEFYPNAEATIEHTKLHPKLEDEPGQDDLLFMTSIPWISFTGIMHPIHMHPVDSVPRFAWGKFFTQNDTIILPLSVQVHHALMDGFHVGRFYQKLQKYLDTPESWMI